MKNLLFTFIVLLSTAFTSVHAACFYPKGGTPVVPNPNNATDREMMEALLKVESYVAQAKQFALCSRRSSDKRAERTLKKAARVAEKYNKAHKIYTLRKNKIHNE